MAGSQSFGKRENEKKKRARRLEKQKYNPQNEMFVISQTK